MSEIEKIIEPTPGKRLSSDPFYNDATYRKLRAMATTKADVGLPDVPNNILELVVNKEQAINEILSGLVPAVGELVSERLSRMVLSPNLLPSPAKAVVLYDTDKEFTITAVDATPAGEGIVIKFVDPQDISLNQALNVALVAGEIIITHATDENGNIATLAGTLETEINSHPEVGLLVQATMGDAGTMDFVGQTQTEGHAPGIECMAGHIFIDGAFLYIALSDMDGLTNQTTDFKKVALQAIV